MTSRSGALRRIVPRLMVGAIAVVVMAACGGATDTAPSATSPEPTPATTGVETSPVPNPDDTVVTTNATGDETPATSVAPATTTLPATTTSAPAADVATTVAAPDQPTITADELAALERDLDEIDQLLTDLELDLQQD